MATLELTLLPNEILLHILSSLRTLDLVVLAGVSRRFYSLVVRIVTLRLSLAASIRGRTLLLECYHPSAKLTQPTLTCTYLGTHGLDDDDFHNANDIDQDNEIDAPDNPAQRLKNMRNLYSRYRPHVGIIERKFMQVPRRGDIPGSRTWRNPRTSQSDRQGEEAQVSESVNQGAPTAGSSNAAEGNHQAVPNLEPCQPLVSHLVHLDAGELFSQLCAQTIVAISPRPDRYHTAVDVSNGIIRVWRDWLAQKNCARDDEPDTNLDHSPLERLPTGSSRTKTNSVIGKDDILWVNDGQNVGVKFRVIQRRWRRDAPILVSAQEDLPVSYEIQFEELLVRTSHLLLKTEHVLLDEQKFSRKAIVFGSF